MKIKLTSLFVKDQEKALAFYTGILDFVKKTDIPMGEFKWLTVATVDNPGDIEMLLEPMAFAPAVVFQKALFEAGIPATIFFVDDIKKEVERLKGLGVVFKKDVTPAGPVTIAVFDDTCGNMIQLVQQ
jgi:catechol 2,3-dioxygenase-like lactoylglutathione lyase family enzyme